MLFTVIVLPFFFTQSMRTQSWASKNTVAMTGWNSFWFLPNASSLKTIMTSELNFNSNAPNSTEKRPFEGVSGQRSKFCSQLEDVPKSSCWMFWTSDIIPILRSSRIFSQRSFNTVLWISALSSVAVVAGRSNHPKCPPLYHWKR